MRILILSVSAGGGHGHAAEALRNYIESEVPNSDIKIIDTLKYINPIIDKVVIGSYLKSLKITPALYGKIYTYSEGDYNKIASTISSKFNKIMTYKLAPLVSEFNPDMIISTHPFPTEMDSIMKEKHNIMTPCITIITDYYPHTSWLHPNIDAYVVSNQDMIDEMISRGIPKDTIYNLGIPVESDFMGKFDRDDTLHELKLDKNKSTILVMGGSLGMGKIKDICEQLDKIIMDIQIIVITGKNQKLYDDLLKSKEAFSKEIRIIGFTNKVNKYMQASDLLLTKPGGLTVTEALICKIPMGIFSPIPGHEEKNAEFLIKNNLAINICDINTCKSKIENLLNSPNRLRTMKDNCEKFAKPNSGNDIVKLIKYLMHNKPNKITVETPNKNPSKDNSVKTFFKSVENYFIKTASKIFVQS